ncbi:MAG TPA: bifunctional proline dehydrogenase/L-glutamate gamma-semialdehyde dehydrogenase PutA [Steroidobacteraceae bacterium]|nr:bifunctional proline dehydrogenase/L-glutamate gamma-semialdehyde dehydrogenase PutA [Steroidobacteraceae bacterium]
MSATHDSALDATIVSINQHYRMAEGKLLSGLVAALKTHEYQFHKTQSMAREFLDALRQSPGDWLTAFLNEYKISNAEGLALLTLSEALLRIPDTATSSQLLRDKIGSADWASHRGQADSWLVNGATLGLSMARSLLSDERGVLHQLATRMGAPIVRNVAISATRLLANHFVLGETIDEALAKAKQGQLLCSFDMLGEAARTRRDAERYFHAYADAIEKVGRSNAAPASHAISVKLSALYPRYEPLQAQHAIPAISEKLLSLAKLAACYQLQLTVDAEESDRLEMSLRIIEHVAREKSLRDWDGLSFAVQAYQKRALPVLQWADELGKRLKRMVGVRLVKGAYWDTEIKRCQQAGLSDYPVFTHKAATDVSYLACAQFMTKSEWIRCAFATHNALTVSQILVWHQQNGKRIEFQRLHGMGAELYRLVTAEHDLPCRVYAPVGGHRELLAYLVRRMLENGANSSFVQQVRRDDIDTALLLSDPVNIVSEQQRPAVTLPNQMFGNARSNSQGLDLSDATIRNSIQEAIDRTKGLQHSSETISTATSSANITKQIVNPADLSQVIGEVTPTSLEDIHQIVRAAKSAQSLWSNSTVSERAQCLELVADKLQHEMLPLMSLLILEAGKTRGDAMNEVREAIDFCRYYAAEARRLMTETALIGPTGESNSLLLASRGVFACISPWNFPLAIFLGQISAALVTGNCVIAKPAPQTPLIAAIVIRIFHECGIPANALHLVPGDGAVGEALVSHRDINGVVFTGSTLTARRIAQALLNDSARPLVPLIAETGGINSMIVDSTALPEQVVADVMTSAFYSAGQRCSALRLLCVQEEIYESVINLLQGAMAELRIGDPSEEDVDIGPVIDLAAKEHIERYLQQRRNDILYRSPLDKQADGHFVAPALLAVNKPQSVVQEVFGPVLHVMPWKSGSLPALIDDINALGYGLTMGIHTRLDSTINMVRALAKVGNLYVNRSMTGAVVGVQPFGGEELSGTGFKAGGPHYLLRFCTERSVSIDTTAAGGNASLLNNFDH